MGGGLAGSGVLSWLPDDVAAQMPPIVAMAAGGRFDRGLSATLTVEAADEQSGENLQAVVQGFVAFARMQISSRPAWQGLLDSIQLLRTGTIVTVTFDVPPETLQSVTPDSLPR